ncbi:MAG: hypothetical protein ACQEUZ_11385 [Pseudomonadota bacterium]
MSRLEMKRVGLSGLLLAGVSAAALALAPMAVSADEHGGSGKGQGGAGAGQGGQGKGAMGAGKGGRSLTDIFHDVTGEDDDGDSDAPDWAGEKGGKAGKGGGRPDTAGSKKGDLFGDLWVILRDEDGNPILTEEGWVQPLDADGNPIPLDEEGQPVDGDATQEVELGRLNVGRAPTSVLDRRAQEVITLLNSATEVSTDPAGRLVLTVDGEDRTIDSPLENLAIYVALMTTGTIPGVSDLPGTEYDFLVDGEKTTADMMAAASFLAAATDKTGEFSTDEIVYINTFLGIETVSEGAVTWSSIDYGDITYDRASVYDGVTAEILVDQGDGTYAVDTIDVYEVIFGETNVSDTDGGIDAFTLMAEDARTVINYIHEYEPPAALD